MAKVIGVVSTKGGVGKTSVTASIGAVLADMGQKILLVDGDFQQSLSSYYRIRHQAQHGIIELITRVNPEHCISTTEIHNLHLIQSNDNKAKLLYWLKESTNNVYYLKAALHKIRDDYDYILIDSQGASSIMQEAIILASDMLISPIVPEALDSQEFMRGTIQMLKSLEPPVGLSIPAPPIPPLYGLIYKQDRTADSLQIANIIRKQFYQLSDGKVSILDTFVPKLSAYAKAAARHEPVHRIETSRTGPTPSALEVYTALVHELLPHLSDIYPDIPGVGSPNVLSLEQPIIKEA
ncbi:MAG: ParA family protein [Gammaproteobacteria bacterium]|nr:ParA family protein [Gammaproteobacteria bacterium]